MDDVRKPDKADTISDLGWPLAEVSSEATRRLCEQGQTVAKTMTDWSTEVSQFLSHRAGRNSEAIGRMTKCQSLPEIFAIQTQWVQDAVDDYTREMSKLMEVNSNILGGLMAPIKRA
jgi:hypothetical protein